MLARWTVFVCIYKKTYYRAKRIDYLTDPKTAQFVRVIEIWEFFKEKIKNYVNSLYKYPDYERLFPVGAEVVQHKMKRHIAKAQVKKIRIHEILKCIKDKEMQSRLQNLYDACKIEELLESIQIYADSIVTGEAKDTGEKKAKELYEYLAGNKSYLLSYQDREGIEIPKAPAGIVYKNLGTQENQNCSNIMLRMKNNKSSWSIVGGGHMTKILVRFANKSIWNDILHYKDAVIESGTESVILNILSAAKVPKVDGKGKQTGNILTGHILYREAKMTFSRKAFLNIFDNKEFT